MASNWSKCQRAGSGNVPLTETCATAHPLEGRLVGIIKPAGISSFAAVARIRRAVGIRKVGHAGTLDPFATGVLVVGLGRSATRRLQEYLRSDKEYYAELALGVATDTYDCTGRVVATNIVPEFGVAELEQVLERFRGDILQVPPPYSAVKVDGVRLYQAARRGRTIQSKPRKVTVYKAELLSFSRDRVYLRVVSSHGTYIRALANDIGVALGCGAHLARLVRTRVGDFRLENCTELDDFLKNWGANAGGGAWK